MRIILLSILLTALLPGGPNALAESEEGNVSEGPAVSIAMSNDKISLRAENAELAAILRFISEAGQVNIVAGPDVSGKISVNLEEVPLAEALDAILGISGFTHYRVGSIIFVTTEANKALLPSIAQDLEVKTFRVNHIDPSQLLTTFEELLAPSGKVWLNPGDMLVVKASAESLSTVEHLLLELDVPPRQVRIAVTIVNVSRDNNLSIGLGFDTLPFSRFGLEALTSGFAQPFPFGSDGTTAISSSGVFMGTLQSDSRAFLEALEEVSDVEILAAPDILALDGEQARIQVGRRLGFKLVTFGASGESIESVEFLEVGTVLTVTPKIADDGLVRLEINPKVSEGFLDDGLPTEITTEVSTTMLVRSGETVIIGGLLNATRQRIKSQVPFLGDIPVLGKLFGRRRWIDNQSEVVVLITPYIVGPMTPSALQQRIDAANGRWGEIGEERLIRDEVPFPKESPARAWEDLLKKGRRSHSQSVGEVEDPEAVGKKHQKPPRFFKKRKGPSV